MSMTQAEQATTPRQKRFLGLTPRQMQVLIAFAAVYTLWGSTYLAIKFADESIPPFVMVATRFIIAGGGLYLWLRLRGAPRPRREHWFAALVMGTLLLVGGNGLLVFAEKTVPSGVAALFIALVPLWMALMIWFLPGGVRPGLRTIIGLALGLVGVGLLASQGAEQGSTFTLIGAGICIIASISWAAGSVYSRTAPVPSVPLLATAMEMICGGAVLVVVALATGEASTFRIDLVSLRSALSLVYLIIFGSLIGFTAYVWLLRNVAPSKVATYAYVNPAIAVLLGWAFDSEVLTITTILASLVIIGAVILTTTARTKTKQPAAGTPTPIDDSTPRDQVISDNAAVVAPDESGTLASPR